MTIRHRLILSHVVVFIVPIMMTLVVIIVSSLGLIIFARNGNHVYIESAWEFQHSYEVVHRILFDDVGIRKENSIGYWLIGLLAPEQNFIRRAVRPLTLVMGSYGAKKNLATLKAFV